MTFLPEDLQLQPTPRQLESTYSGARSRRHTIHFRRLFRGGGIRRARAWGSIGGWGNELV